VALLILRGAVVAGAGEAGLRALVDLGEIESEVRRKVGMGGIDTAVEDGNAYSFADGGVPGAVYGTAGNIVPVATDLTDSPTLGRVVVGVGGGGRVARADDDGEGGGKGLFGSGAEEETVSGDEPVVQDVFDVGLEGELAERLRVLLGGGAGCLDDGDAEVLVALEKTSADCLGATERVAGDGGVAIDDQVSVRNDAAICRLADLSLCSGDGR
jgi:hypothetical protein